MKDFVNYDNELILYNGELILFDDYIKRLHLETNGHGTISAAKTTGMEGETVRLYNTADEYYRFDSYSANGGTITNTNRFKFGEADDQTAKAIFRLNQYNTTGDLLSPGTNMSTHAFKTGSDSGTFPAKYTGSDIPTAQVHAGISFSSIPGYPIIYSTDSTGPNFPEPCNLTATFSAFIYRFTVPDNMPSAQLAMNKTAIVDTKTLVDIGSTTKSRVWAVTFTANNVTGVPYVNLITNFNNECDTNGLSGNWTAEYVLP